MADKKKFKDTKFGQFLSKAGNVIKENGGDILDIASTAIMGSPMGAIKKTAQLLKEGAENGDPAAVKLSQEFQMMQMEFEKEMRELDIEEFGLMVKDRDSARDREVAMIQAGKKNDILQIVVGASAVVAFLFVVITPLFHQVGDVEVYHSIKTLTEVIATAVVFYYFGSSRGSREKDQLKRS
jgi:hypothetical protein